LGLVCAQENGDSSETPVNLRPLQLILPRDHLFGDWYGVRSRLEEQGFIPTLTFVTDIAGNPGVRIRGSLTPIISAWMRDPSRRDGKIDNALVLGCQVGINF
jgi:hypothetical protein